MLWTNEKQAYSKGKLDAERACYAFGEKTGIDVVSICPFHIMGPLLGIPHNTTWQHRLGLVGRLCRAAPGSFQAATINVISLSKQLISHPAAQTIFSIGSLLASMSFPFQGGHKGLPRKLAKRQG